MDRQEILKKVDHTLLAQTATWEEIKEICDDAIKYKTASVCIPSILCKTSKSICTGSDGSLYGYWLSKWI